MRYEKYVAPFEAPADYLSGRPVAFIRVPGRYDTNAASEASMLICSEPTRAQQQFKEECDINTIAKNFGITGRLPQNVRMPTFGDFTGVSDYRSALNAMQWARDSFMAMPAEVRRRFDHDPQQFLAFCSDERNRDEAIKLGLVVAPPAPKDIPATPAPAEPPKPA